jgi:predicted tellurium resistance membrane protein TerC
VPIKDQIDTLLQEKMDRKDFLKYAGTVILGIIGVTGLVRMVLGNRGVITIDDTRPKGSGYGNSSYGK